MKSEDPPSGPIAPQTEGGNLEVGDATTMRIGKMLSVAEPTCKAIHICLPGVSTSEVKKTYVSDWR